MRDRRQGRTVLIVLAVIGIAAMFVFLGQLFAQEEGMAPEPPGMEPGAPGMAPEAPGMAPGMEGMPPDMMGAPGVGMGMGAGGGGGGALQWTHQPMDEALCKSYDEFLAETGEPRAAIPDVFLFDEETGEPRKYTETQWRQLQRIYAGRRAVEEGVPTAGKPGYGLATRITREIAVKEKELEAVRHLYNVGLESFTFEIGYPQVEHSAIQPGMTTVPIQIGVIMKVKPGIAQRYPSLVYRKLKPFDNYGRDRQLFRIVDYEGGIWNPKEVWLWNGAVNEWNSLWSSNQVRLTLYDVSGREIVEGAQSAGHTGGICAQLVHPDTLNYAPMHETIIPPRDHSFEGGHLNLDYKKGWYYSFSFNIPLAQLSALDRAEAVLIGAGGVEGSRGATQPLPVAAESLAGVSSRGALQAGAAQAMGRARTGLPAMGMLIPPGFY
ncbi:MAG: hypothetical protein AB7Y46_18715 [Armatimonadota bacterium]